MWEQSLQGLIKALRASKNDEEKVIRTALDEIAGEIRQSDWEVKAAAVLKLIYLEMLGHPHLSQHAFPVIECMSQSRFHLKQIGYLAASQSFREGTDVILLTNNLIKKDLTTPAPQPTALLLVLSSLPNLLLSSPQLVADLHPELIKALTHSRPMVRRAAILVLGRLWASQAAAVPMSTETIVEKLRERLGDEDSAVVGAAANVCLELSSVYTGDDVTALLALAPDLFELLTTSTNNWILIKIIKMFTLLTPVEPRLVRKLLPPLRQLISTTPAMSLLYECINAVIVGGMLEGEGGDSLAASCVDKLASFLEDVDQNLRYMALLALVRLLPTHPGLVAKHYDTILHCVNDSDVTIRSRALNLVDGMVDRSNLQDIVGQLLRHLSARSKPALASTSAAVASLQSAARGDAGTSSGGSATSSPAYRSSLITLIVTISTRNTYANVSNFPWLIDTLCTLTSTSLSAPGVPANLISDAIVDIAARARAVRPYIAKRMAAFLVDETFVANALEAEGAARQVLDAAAWIVGEYASELEDPQAVLAALFDLPSLLALPSSLAATFVHNGVKLFSHIATASCTDLDPGLLHDRILPCLAACSTPKPGREVELIERTSQLSSILQLFLSTFEAYKARPPPSQASADETSEWATGTNGIEEEKETAPAAILANLFTGAHELNPVNAKAQSMVAVPDELDLEAWIVPPRSMRDEEWEREVRVEGEVDEYGRPRRRPAVYEEPEVDTAKRKKGKGKGKKRATGYDEVEEDQRSRRNVDRKEGQRAAPYYIDEEEDDIDSIPVVQLDLGLSPPSLRPASNRRTSSSSKASKTPKVKPRPPTPPPIFLDIEGELPPETLQRINGTSSAATPPPESPPPAEPFTEDVAPPTTEVKVVKIKKKDKDGAPKANKKSKRADVATV